MQVDGLGGQRDLPAHLGICHGAGNGQIIGSGHALLHAQAAVDAIKGKAFFGDVAQARQALQAQQADEFECAGVHADDVPSTHVDAQLAAQCLHVKRNGRPLPAQGARHAALACLDQIAEAQMVQHAAQIIRLRTQLQRYKAPGQISRVELAASIP